MHNEGNYKQCEKTALRMGEKNSKSRNRKRINLKNIQANPADHLQENKLTMVLYKMQNICFISMISWFTEDEMKR